MGGEAKEGERVQVAPVGKVLSCHHAFEIKIGTGDNPWF